MFDKILTFIRELYSNRDRIGLHEPIFQGNEKKYLEKCIDTTFVSSVGEYVNLFEKQLAEFTGSARAIATANGTSALHAALILAGVKAGDDVLTQALTFVATANAITYCGAKPIFLDSDEHRLGMSAKALEMFLKENADVRNDGFCYNKKSDRKIVACLPMHTFGHPVDIERIAKICSQYHIPLIEDAAESLGSYVGKSHTGTFGRIGILSFNGNKPLTTGGGGAILTNDPELGDRARHLTTTAKVQHAWEFSHDEVGYNYRMPNINAALGCAQMEQLPGFLENKRETANFYREFFAGLNVPFIAEPEGSRSNYWLNTILLKDVAERDAFLKTANDHGIQCRPVWTLMPDLPMYKTSECGPLKNARRIQSCAVNIPSGVRSR
jgi:perosamine synthetase